MIEIQNSLLFLKFLRINKYVTKLSRFKIFFDRANFRRIIKIQNPLLDKIFTKSNYQDSKSFSLLKTSFDLFSLLRSNFHKIVKIQDPSSSSIPNFHKNSINRSNRFFSREASIDQFPQNSPLFLSVPSSLSVQNFLEIVEKFTTRKKMGRKSRE